MRLSDIMGHMDLSVWPQMGLVLFLVAFAAITWKTLSRKHSAEYEAVGMLPFGDEPASNFTQTTTEDKGN